MHRSSPFALVVLTATPAALADPPKRAAPDIDDAHEDGADAIERAEESTAPKLPRATERVSRAPLQLSLLAWTGYSGTVAQTGAGAVLIVPFDVFAARHDDGARFVRVAGGMPSVPGISEPPKNVVIDEAALPARELQRLVRAAWHAADLDQDDRRLTDLARRSRTSAVLPELRLKAVWTNDASLRLTPTDADPYRIESGDGTGMLYEARATWRLDRLVFADDEVAIERLRVERNEQRLKLTLHIVESVAAWQKAHARAQDPTISPVDRADATVREIVAAAALDLLTDGAWSKRDEEETTKR